MISDINTWRRAQRERLLAVRQTLSPQYREACTAAIAAQLDALIAEHRPDIVGVYWPIRAEPDLRPWMHARAAQKIRFALPVTVAPREALTYRLWQPGAPMAHGLWGIPHPADGPNVVPALVLAPLVGFDAAGYRLGYGGGFFDRTLATLKPRPLAVGVGYPQTAIETLFPQSYDIPMDYIFTGYPEQEHHSPVT